MTVIGKGKSVKNSFRVTGSLQPMLRSIVVGHTLKPVNLLAPLVYSEESRSWSSWVKTRKVSPGPGPLMARGVTCPLIKCPMWLTPVVLPNATGGTEVSSPMVYRYTCET